MMSRKDRVGQIVETAATGLTQVALALRLGVITTLFSDLRAVSSRRVPWGDGFGKGPWEMHATHHESSTGLARTLDASKDTSYLFAVVGLTERPTPRRCWREEGTL
jgi:hypothetical protein